jgi:hypothetical protein
MTSPSERMAEHPDILAMRMPYERAGESVASQVTAGLTLLAGVYLAASPWIVGFAELSTIALNNLITGVAVALLALGFASAFGRTHGLAWVVPAIGVWIIVSPWAVAGDVNFTRVVISNVIIGGVIVLLGLATVGVSMWQTGRRRRGR